MYTPLHAACASGQINVVHLLLDFGVEVDAVSAQGNTSLHIACLNGQDIVAAALVSHGASVDARNHKGQVSHDNQNRIRCMYIVFFMKEKFFYFNYFDNHDILQHVQYWGDKGSIEDLAIIITSSG